MLGLGLGLAPEYQALLILEACGLSMHKTRVTVTIFWQCSSIGEMCVAYSVGVCSTYICTDGDS